GRTVFYRASSVSRMLFPFVGALAILAAPRMIPRLALVCWFALLLGAAMPLAIGWARIVPADDPEERVSHDRFAIVLLVLVTLSFVLQLPGFSTLTIGRWLATAIPQPLARQIISWGAVFFAVIPGPAEMYAILRPNPLRRPLFASVIMITALWLVGTYIAHYRWGC